MTLLNPGPVTLSPRVRKALQGPDLCHREPEFAQLTLEILESLEEIYSTNSSHQAVLLASSGTGAVEAMLGSLAPGDGLTVVAANGVYGERMASMLDAMRKPYRLVSAPWNEPVDIEAVGRCLQSHPEATHLATVHHETTTGRLNDLQNLGKLCSKHNCRILLDAVSSFGAEEIDFKVLPLEAVAGTANKCLHGIPGAAFVLLERESMTGKESQACSLYLDLFRYREQRKTGYSPFTQPVQSLYALREALEELQEEGGWKARRCLYQQRSQQLRDELENLGVQTLLDPKEYASMLTSFKLPNGRSYEQLHADLKEEGFIIYAGQGDLKKTIFRLATMGHIPPPEMERLCAALRDHACPTAPSTE